MSSSLIQKKLLEVAKSSKSSVSELACKYLEKEREIVFLETFLSGLEVESVCRVEVMYSLRLPHGSYMHLTYKIRALFQR